MRYDALLSIVLKHSYYENGLCPDFALVPTANTAMLLKNHRCIVKSMLNGINIGVPADDRGTPMIEFAEGTHLSFDLRLRNSEFSLYTDFTCLPDDGDFQMTYVSQKGRRTADVFANVDIERDFNRIGTLSPTIEIAFSARPARWVYYFVTSLGSNDSDFSITCAVPKRPGLTWQQIAPADSDGIARMLAKQYPGMRRLRFVSDQAIPSRESGLKNVRLSFGQTTIDDNLPSPSFRNYHQTNIDPASTQPDAVFTIVKCISNTTLTKV